MKKSYLYFALLFFLIINIFIFSENDCLAPKNQLSASFNKISNIALLSPEFLIEIDKALLNYKRNNFNETDFTNILYKLLELSVLKSSLTSNDLEYFIKFIKIHLFNKTTLKKIDEKIIESKKDFQSAKDIKKKMKKDSFRLHAIHNFLAEIFEIKYIEAFEEIPWKSANFSLRYYRTKKLQNQLNNIAGRYIIQKKFLPILLKVLFEIEKEVKFIKKEAIENIDYYNAKNVTIQLNPAGGIRAFGADDSTELPNISEKIKIALKNEKIAENEIENLLNFFYFKKEDHEYSESSSTFLDISNLPFNEMGVLISLSHNDEMVFLPNPFPYFEEEAQHFVLASIDRTPQSINENLIIDIFMLMNELKGFHFGFNGIGAGASIPERRHFQAYKKKLPIFDLKFENAKHENMFISDNGVKAAFFYDETPMATILIEGQDLSNVSKNTYNLISHLENTTKTPYNIHWVYENGIYKNYIILRKNENSKLFGNMLAVVESGGIFISENLIFLLKTKIDNFELKDMNQKTAASKLFAVLSSQRFKDNVEFIFNDKNELTDFNFINTDEKLNNFLSPYFNSQNIDKENIKGFVTYLMQLLIKNYGLLKTQNNLKIEDISKLDLIDKDGINANFGNDFAQASLPKDEAKEIFSIIFKFDDIIIKELSELKNPLLKSA